MSGIRRRGSGKVALRATALRPTTDAVAGCVAGIGYGARPRRLALQRIVDKAHQPIGLDEAVRIDAAVKVRCGFGCLDFLQ